MKNLLVLAAIALTGCVSNAPRHIDPNMPPVISAADAPPFCSSSGGHAGTCVTAMVETAVYNEITK
jgi:hypothetical protein